MAHSNYSLHMTAAAFFVPLYFLFKCSSDSCQTQNERLTATFFSQGPSLEARRTIARMFFSLLTAVTSENISLPMLVSLQGPS